MAIDQLSKSFSTVVMHMVDLLNFISTDRYSRISEESVFAVHFR